MKKNRRAPGFQHAEIYTKHTRSVTKKRMEHTHENHKKRTSDQEWAEKTIDRHGK